MKATFRSLLLQAAGLLWAVWGLVACSTPARITYFQDLRPGESEQQVVAATEIKVRPGDKLSIIVNSRDPQLTQLFNLPYVTKQLGQGNLIANNMYSQGVSGYTVDEEGRIDFPVLGKIEIAGKNREEIAAFIKEELLAKNLVKDPVVTVEYVNLGVSVLGEVSRPGWFRIDRDHLSVLDALSFAGDLTIQGRRNNVTVIRKEGDVQKFYPIDLTSAKSLYSSPAYYLRQNDMVYVQPNPMRDRQSTAAGNTFLQPTFWMSFASLVTSIVTIFLIK